MGLLGIGVRFRAGIFLLAVGLSGCIAIPVEETNSFVEAVAAVKTASDLLVDQLNVAEKAINLQRIKSRPNAERTFDTGDAYYYTTIPTYAPTTRQFKAAMDVVKNYADLLKALVEGKSVAAARGKIEQIAADLNIVIGGAVATGAVAALKPLLEKALLAQSRAEAKALVERGTPAIAALIDKLRDATPAMFEILMHDSFAGAANSAEQSEKTKVTLSNFIVLLDRLKDTSLRLAEAYKRPGDPFTLASLATATGELKADVEIARQTFAALRRL
jgi:hypothetical protein